MTSDFEIVSFEPWKDGVVRIRIAADEPEGRVCHTFYARQVYVESEAVRLLRDVIGVIDTHADYRIVDILENDGTLDKIRRLLAAQEGT